SLPMSSPTLCCSFFFTAPAPPAPSPLSLHDALPIFGPQGLGFVGVRGQHFLKVRKGPLQRGGAHRFSSEGRSYKKTRVRTARRSVIQSTQRQHGIRDNSPSLVRQSYVIGKGVSHICEVVILLVEPRVVAAYPNDAT